MTITRTDSWAFALTGISHTFEVQSVEVILDERNSVYASATVVVAPYPSSIDDSIRPAIKAATLRGTLDATVSTVTPTPSTQTRDFNLFVHDRVINDDGSVTFLLASDEGLLELRGLVSTTRADRYTYATPTARKVINNVLAAYTGGVLEAGSVDADLTRTAPRKNLIVNPSFEVDVLHWAANSNASGLVRSTGRSVAGVASLRFTATAAGASSIVSDAFAIEEGAWYIAMAYISSTVSRSANISIRTFETATSTTPVAIFAGASYPTNATTFDGVFFDLSFRNDTGNAAGVLGTFARIYIGTAANAAGNQHYVDAVKVEQLDPLTLKDPSQQDVYPYLWYGEYFDGATNPSPTYLNVSWVGDAHASQSISKGKDNRSFDLMLQSPGQGARDFLDPIIGLTGGRLFCDEDRKWRLVNNAYSVAGMIALDEATITSRSDKVSLSDTLGGVPSTFTGVVVVYEFSEPSTGLQTTRYDSAGNATGRVFRHVINGPYPGAGAAAAILARAEGRERSLTVTALTNLGATPGKAVTYALDGIDLEGVISQVRWEWTPTSSAMEVVPRDLVEV